MRLPLLWKLRLQRIASVIVAIAFSTSLIVPPHNSFAQTSLNLPALGTMLSPTHVFYPTMIKGMEIHPTDPLKFDFLIETGDLNLDDQSFRAESAKLVGYFLASLTTPEDQMWVNLSPDEPDRIIPEQFGQTQMGRDLLAEDYILKQLAASLTFPERALSTNLAHQLSQFNSQMMSKIWIVPDRAVVHQYDKGVFIMEARLRVRFEDDFFGINSVPSSFDTERTSDLGTVGTADLRSVLRLNEQQSLNDRQRIHEIIKEDSSIPSIESQRFRENILPAIEKEVNEGEHFANLRQIYHAMILATWYKQNLKNTLLAQGYIDQNKIDGINHHDDQANQKIYQQYLESFKVGVYDYIKEEYDPATQQVIPKKYFSGGAALQKKKITDFAMLSQTEQIDLFQASVHGRVNRVQANAQFQVSNNTDAAMLTSVPMSENSMTISGQSSQSAAVGEFLSVFDLSNVEIVNTFKDTKPSGVEVVRGIVHDIDIDSEIPMGNSVFRELVHPQLWPHIKDQLTLEFVFKSRPDGSREMVAVIPVIVSDVEIVGQQLFYFDLSEYYVPLDVLKNVKGQEAFDQWVQQAKRARDNHEAILRYVALNPDRPSVARKWNHEQQTSYVYVEVNEESGLPQLHGFDLPTLLVKGEALEKIKQNVFFSAEVKPHTMLTIFPTVYSPGSKDVQTADTSSVRDFFLNALDFPFVEDGRLLDLGTGSGYLLWMMYQATKNSNPRPRYFAIDKNPIAVANARVNLQQIANIDVAIKLHDNVVDRQGHYAVLDDGGKPLTFQLLVTNAPFFPEHIAKEMGDDYDRLDTQAFELKIREMQQKSMETQQVNHRGSVRHFHDGGFNAVYFWYTLLKYLPTLMDWPRAKVLAWNAPIEGKKKDPVIRLGKKFGLSVTVHEGNFTNKGYYVTYDIKPYVESVEAVESNRELQNVTDGAKDSAQLSEAGIIESRKIMERVLDVAGGKSFTLRNIQERSGPLRGLRLGDIKFQEVFGSLDWKALVEDQAIADGLIEKEPNSANEFRASKRSLTFRRNWLTNEEIRTASDSLILEVSGKWSTFEEFNEAVIQAIFKLPSLKERVYFLKNIRRLQYTDNDNQKKTFGLVRNRDGSVDIKRGKILPRDKVQTLEFGFGQRSLDEHGNSEIRVLTNEEFVKASQEIAQKVNGKYDQPLVFYQHVFEAILELKSERLAGYYIWVSDLLSVDFNFKGTGKMGLSIKKDGRLKLKTKMKDRAMVSSSNDSYAHIPLPEGATEGIHNFSQLAEELQSTNPEIRRIAIEDLSEYYPKHMETYYLLVSLLDDRSSNIVQLVKNRLRKVIKHLSVKVLVRLLTETDPHFIQDDALRLLAINQLKGRKDVEKSEKNRILQERYFYDSSKEIISTIYADISRHRYKQQSWIDHRKRMLKILKKMIRQIYGKDFSKQIFVPESLISDALRFERDGKNFVVQLNGQSFYLDEIDSNPAGKDRAMVSKDDERQQHLEQIRALSREYVAELHVQLGNVDVNKPTALLRTRFNSSKVNSSPNIILNVFIKMLNADNNRTQTLTGIVKSPNGNLVLEFDEWVTRNTATINFEEHLQWLKEQLELLKSGQVSFVLDELKQQSAALRKRANELVLKIIDENRAGDFLIASVKKNVEKRSATIKKAEDGGKLGSIGFGLVILPYELNKFLRGEGVTPLERKEILDVYTHLGYSPHSFQDRAMTAQDLQQRIGELERKLAGAKLNLELAIEDYDAAHEAGIQDAGARLSFQDRIFFDDLISQHKSNRDAIKRELEEARALQLDQTTDDKALLSKTPGGIDLNPSSLDLQTTNASMPFVLPAFTPELLDQLNHATGLAPVIINVTPVINVPLLIGLAGTIPSASDDDTEQTLDRGNVLRNERFEDMLVGG